MLLSITFKTLFGAKSCNRFTIDNNMSSINLSFGHRIRRTGMEWMDWEKIQITRMNIFSLKSEKNSHRFFIQNVIEKLNGFNWPIIIYVWYFHSSANESTRNSKFPFKISHSDGNPTRGGHSEIIFFHPAPVPGLHGFPILHKHNQNKRVLVLVNTVNTVILCFKLPGSVFISDLT